MPRRKKSRRRIARPQLGTMPNLALNSGYQNRKLRTAKWGSMVCLPRSPCFAGPHFPWPPPFAPPAPQRIAPPCSSASQLLWRSLTPHVRASSDTAPRLPDADQICNMPVVGRGVSRFPRKELPHMPVSSTTPGRLGARNLAPIRVAFRQRNDVSTQDESTFAAQWLAYALPCQRFADALAGSRA